MTSIMARHKRQRPLDPREGQLPRGRGGIHRPKNILYADKVYSALTAYSLSDNGNFTGNDLRLVLARENAGGRPESRRFVWIVASGHNCSNAISNGGNRPNASIL